MKVNIVRSENPFQMYMFQFLCNRGNYMSNPGKGKWYKFNDTDVEAFEMTDAALEEECFGGTYKAKVYEQCESYLSAYKSWFIFTLSRGEGKEGEG